MSVVCCQGPITRTEDVTECGVCECDRGTHTGGTGPLGLSSDEKKIPLPYDNYCLPFVIWFRTP